MKPIFYKDEFFESKGLTCRLIDPNDEKFNMVGYISSDELNMTISNSWENTSKIFSLSDAVGNLYEKAGQFMAQGGTSLVKSVEEVWEGVKTLNNNDWDPSKLLTKKVKPDHKNQFMGDYHSLLQKSFHSGDDWMFSFKGSSINYPTSFSVLLVTDSVNKDIYKELQSYIKKFMGEMNYVGESGRIGLQDPPNGYESSQAGLIDVIPNIKGNKVNNPDDFVKGSFILVVGDPNKGNAGMRFPGAVVESLSINTSQVKAIHGNNELRPLYITLEVTLKYVQRPSRSNLLDIYS